MFENLSEEWVYVCMMVTYLIGIIMGWKACKLIMMAKEADAREEMSRRIFRPNMDY